MSLKKAKEEGALGIFNKKYGKKVFVYQIGNFSKEICSGPHVKNTRELGKFKIIKEESSSSGVRRIKAILEWIIYSILTQQTNKPILHKNIDRKSVV